MDAATLSQAMGGAESLSRYRALCPAFNQAMVLANITTVQRAAMWCAQLGHESLGLSAMEEFASGAAYEWRADLGNTQPGDGVRFKGRGPIQVTGRSNYTRLSQWAFVKGLVPTAKFFVDNPTQLASDKYGFLGAVWYWTAARDMNSFADRGDIEGASVAVNGGYNGYQDRVARWNRCLAIGAALLPESEFLMSLDDNQQITVLGASIQTGQAQETRTADEKGNALPEGLRTLGPRVQRHSQYYNVDGNPRFAKARQKLAYLRAMTMDLWNELVFDGYTAQVADPQLDEGKYGSPVGFIIATHGNSRKSLLILQRLAKAQGVDVSDIVGKE